MVTYYIESIFSKGNEKELNVLYSVVQGPWYMINNYCGDEAENEMNIWLLSYIKIEHKFSTYIYVYIGYGLHILFIYKPIDFNIYILWPKCSMQVPLLL